MHNGFYCGSSFIIDAAQIYNNLFHPDAVTARDMQRVGEKLMESNPSMAVIGDLKDVPARWEVETALHSNGGLLDKKSRILSKIFT